MATEVESIKPALLRERLKKLNISVMTPLEALNLLDDQKKRWCDD
jgi:hypothetical protein